MRILTEVDVLKGDWKEHEVYPVFKKSESGQTKLIDADIIKTIIQDLLKQTENTFASNVGREELSKPTMIRSLLIEIQYDLRKAFEEILK